METPPDYVSKPRTPRRILAENLRIRRLKRHISQEALGYLAGIDRSYVSAIERGECNISIDIIERLAKAFETDVVVLLTEPDLEEVPDYMVEEIRHRIRDDRPRYTQEGRPVANLTVGRASAIRAVTARDPGSTGTSGRKGLSTLSLKVGTSRRESYRWQ